uniref:Uncharacterized protein n=1 Tax=Helianthus annuus TaxID=4232 RepID=A0A251STE2_HELAN
MAVDTNIQIPIVQKCFSRVFRHKWSHVIIHQPCEIQVTIFGFIAKILPVYFVLNLRYVTRSMWERLCEFGYFTHSTTIWVESQHLVFKFFHPFEDELELSFRNRILHIIGFDLEWVESLRIRLKSAVVGVPLGKPV